MIATMTMRARALAAVSWWGGAFGDMTEPIRSCDGYSSLRGFFGVKFELDFHCRAAMGGTEEDNSKYEEEQY